MNIKKTILSSAVITALGVAGSAQAAFLQAGTTGTIDFTGGCFTFGDCAIGGTGNVADNDITVRGNGTGVAGDGLVGQISFTVAADGNTLIIDSLQQDTYTGTAGGNFALNTDASSSSGFISDSGEVSLSLARSGYPQFFSYLDGSPWNIDDSTVATNAGTATNTWDVLTTGTSTNLDPSTGDPNASGTGVALSSSGAGMWSGMVVNFGNVGAGWGSFDNTPYSEKFNITVNGVAATTSPVPVPAAVWLFGSGMLGLVGIARRRRAQA
ncbi:MAG: hypothetical protein CMN57_00315 [Gammaproteobacteria bacterium]|nr:hypothetical protein [Gammaproteobacteria bacterium]